MKPKEFDSKLKTLLNTKKYKQMKYRFTIKELQDKNSPDYLSDAKMLRALVIERQQTCTNVHAPLYQRLQQLYNKLSKEMELENA